MLIVCWLSLLVEVRVIGRWGLWQLGYLMHLLNGLVLCFCLGVDITVCLALFEAASLPLLGIVVYTGYTDRRLLAATLMAMVTVLGSGALLFGVAGYLSDVANVLALTQSPLYYPSFVVLVLLSIWVYATKIPCYPVYVWLTEAHVEVSAEMSMILAGSVLKLGLVGCIKLVGAWHIGSGYQLALCIGLGYCTLGTALMTLLLVVDLKRMLGFGSVWHSVLGLTVTQLDDELLNRTMEGLCLVHGFLASSNFWWAGSHAEACGCRIPHFMGPGYGFSCIRSLLVLTCLGYSVGHPYTTMMVVEIQSLTI